jgi:cytochrome c551/c552
VFSCITLSIVGFTCAQFLPVARVNAKADNAVVMQWDSPETMIVAQHACFDCHTNQTKWPWYSYVAPASWLTIDHVEGGRNEINFDALNEMPTRRAANTFKHFAEQMNGGLMPPADYMLMHPESRLTEAEREKLLKGLQQSTLLTLPKQNK